MKKSYTKLEKQLLDALYEAYPWIGYEDVLADVPSTKAYEILVKHGRLQNEDNSVITKIFTTAAKRREAKNKT